MPLPIFFFGNLLFGLAGTQAVSLPMFTVLRRFSIWLTMIGEQLILRYINSYTYFIRFFFFTRQTQSIVAQASVYLMLLGAVIAASDDLTFNWFGYSFLIINNICTAAQGVVIKQKLVNKVKINFMILKYV
jgi:solute carrier family 35 protein